MGATDFSVKSSGKTINEAFSQAREQALWEHGHGGYTGTIAEKNSFSEFKLPKGYSLEDILKFLSDDRTIPPEEIINWVVYVRKVYNDKWGPAVAFELTDEKNKTPTRKFYFCGIASE